MKGYSFGGSPPPTAWPNPIYSDGVWRPGEWGVFGAGRRRLDELIARAGVLYAAAVHPTGMGTVWELEFGGVFGHPSDNQFWVRVLRPVGALAPPWRYPLARQCTERALAALNQTPSDTADVLRRILAAGPAAGPEGARDADRYAGILRARARALTGDPAAAITAFRESEIAEAVRNTLLIGAGTAPPSALLDVLHYTQGVADHPPAEEDWQVEQFFAMLTPIPPSLPPPRCARCAAASPRHPLVRVQGQAICLSCACTLRNNN